MLMSVVKPSEGECQVRKTEEDDTHGKQRVYIDYAYQLAHFCG